MPQTQIEIKTTFTPDLIKTFGDYTNAVTVFRNNVQSGFQEVGQSVTESAGFFDDLASNVEGLMDVFDRLQPLQDAIAAQVADISGAYGQVVQAIEPATSAFLNGMDTLGKFKEAGKTAVDSLEGLVKVLPKVKGTEFTLVEFFTSGASSAAGFAQSVKLLALTYGPLALVAATAATALYFIGKDIHKFNELKKARAAERESELGVGKRVEDYNRGIQRRVDLEAEAGTISKANAEQEKSHLQDLEQQYLQGKIKYEEYVRSLDKVRWSLHEFLPEKTAPVTAPPALEEQPAPETYTPAPSQYAPVELKFEPETRGMLVGLDAVLREWEGKFNQLPPTLSLSLEGSGQSTSDNPSTLGLGSSSAIAEPASAVKATTQKKKRTEYDMTWGDQFQRVKDGAEDKWGAWSKQMADTFSTVFEKGISSISSGIAGLIEGTKTWGQALQSISSTILNTVISAFVEMGVRYVMTKLFMAATDSAVAKKNQTENLTTLGTALPTAMAQSGAEGGWIGLAAFLALFVGGLAALTALTSSSGTRATGGPVMAGLPYIVGEKRPELFVPGQSGFILPSVPSVMDMPAGNLTPGTSHAAPTNIHFAGVLDSEELALKGLSGKRGKKFLLDFNKGSVREVTGRG